MIRYKQEVEYEKALDKYKKQRMEFGVSVVVFFGWVLLFGMQIQCWVKHTELPSNLLQLMSLCGGYFWHSFLFGANVCSIFGKKPTKPDISKLTKEDEVG